MIADLEILAKDKSNRVFIKSLALTFYDLVLMDIQMNETPLMVFDKKALIDRLMEDIL